MWRALFLAIGIFMIVIGIQCLGVAQFVLKSRESADSAVSIFDAAASLGPQKVISPPAWAPWSMMASGAVVCLYSFTIPKRVAGN